MANKTPILLGVNIDHVATLRQVRGTTYPDPLLAALEAEIAGADGITLHMREDLRHIQAHDVKRIRASLQTRMNLELAVTRAMLDFALEIRPTYACLVPEKREELTTEGGLDVVHHQDSIQAAVAELSQNGIDVSLFIDPEASAIDVACAVGAPIVELHTGCYADAVSEEERTYELKRLQDAAQYAHDKGLIVNAGHGLHYHNVKPIAAIPVMHELNIGHAIIARAIFVGMQEAVSSMRSLMLEGRGV
jgi:pyridoxine 5-phosphate synthase